MTKRFELVVPFAMSLALYSSINSGGQPADARVVKHELNSASVSRQAGELQATEAVKNRLQNLTGALAAGDAATVAANWVSDGTYTNEEGQSWQGRTSLEKRYAAVFAAEGGVQVEFMPTDTRFLSEKVALTEGFVKLKDDVSGLPDTRFSIVLQRQEDGRWLIAAANEIHYTTINKQSEPLKALSWLIGDWAVSKDGSSMEMSAEWAADKKFIRIKQKLQKAGAAVFDSQQMIGWDPRGEQIVSWSFDATGGYGSGMWIKRGNKWFIDSTGVAHDGHSTRATNMISEEGNNSFTWQSVARSVDGQAYADTAAVKLERLAVKL